MAWLRSAAGLPVAALAMIATTGCDFTGDFLFSEVEGVPSIYVLNGEDGGPLVPVQIEASSDPTDDTARRSADAATIYAEMAPPNTSAEGGVTFTFLGTGRNVCVWVDPEVVSWNTAISRNPSEEQRRYGYPDNVFDDGDIDIFAGLSVYYTGSPSVIGDFEVAYEDSLGNDIGIQLFNCPDTLSDSGRAFAHAGKGAPEWCTINTEGFEDVSFTVLLRNFSTPLDDSRLSYGLILFDGSCTDLVSTITSGGGTGQDTIDPVSAECIVQGEAIQPYSIDTGGEEVDTYAPFFGFEAASDVRWPGSIQFESQFCAVQQPLDRFCRREADRVAENGFVCSWESFDAFDYTVDERCFCGDPEDVPDPENF